MGQLAPEPVRDNLLFGLEVLDNAIYGSRPGNDNCWGSTIWGMYDWGTYICGLIETGTWRKREGYYALSIACRGMNGARTTYQTTCGNRNILALTTKDTAGKI